MKLRLLEMLVQDFLNGDRSLGDLHARIIQMLHVDQPGDHPVETLQLGQALELRIAEYTGGHVADDDFRNLLREEAGLNPSVIGPEPDLVFGSSATTRRVAALA